MSKQSNEGGAKEEGLIIAKESGKGNKVKIIVRIAKESMFGSMACKIVVSFFDCLPCSWLASVFLRAIPYSVSSLFL